MKLSRILFLSIVVSALLIPTAPPFVFASSPADSIGMVNDECTGEAIGPDLFMTASHCTGNLGGTVDFYIREGVAKREYVGINVWDSYYIPRSNLLREGLDLCLVRVVKGGTFKHWLSFNPSIPKPNTYGINISMSLGLEYWVRTVGIEGMYHDSQFGWVIVYRGDMYPGASGSVVLQDGKIVGILTHGVFTSELFVGATAGRILQAVRDYRWNGDMVIVLENDVFHIERVPHP